jgi:hypothetical protein
MLLQRRDGISDSPRYRQVYYSDDSPPWKVFCHSQLFLGGDSLPYPESLVMIGRLLVEQQLFIFSAGSFPYQKKLPLLGNNLLLSGKAPAWRACQGSPRTKLAEVR